MFHEMLRFTCALLNDKENLTAKHCRLKRVPDFTFVVYEDQNFQALVKEIVIRIN